MARSGFFLALLWAFVLLLYQSPHSSSAWLRKALREGQIPTSKWDLEVINDLEVPFQLLGVEGVRLKAKRGLPQLPTLGPLVIAGVPNHFRFEEVRVRVKGLNFEAEKGIWMHEGLQLKGRVRVFRHGRILMEGPSLSLEAGKDRIDSKDLVLLHSGSSGNKRALLGISLKSEDLKSLAKF